MKRIAYIMITAACFMWACEADPDEGLPSFDNSLPLYVQLGTTDIEAEEGDEVAVTVEVPEVIYSDVIVQWEVAGDISNTGSVTIAEGDLSSDVIVVIPDDGQATDGGTATFTLTAVDNGLTLGRQNATNSVITTIIEWTDND